MKISLNWLKSFININLDNITLQDILTDIGLEVEGIENYESIPGGLKGLEVAEVLSCISHPNADKLKLTSIQTLNDGVLQVVCGAPNVAKGQKVILAKIGTLLYPSSGEPFEIKKSKIRGEVSEGMLCAQDEIGIGESHEGIIVLPEEVSIGTPASQLYNMENDTIFEIGLTPNRTDAQSHYGVARDLRAALNFRNGENLNISKGKSVLLDNGTSTIQVRVKNKQLAPRYAGCVIDNIRVAPSPDWLQHRLKAIGLKPINNIVDITNYILHSYGQPLHAFDMRAVGDTIEVKTLEEGRKFKTLDGNTISLHAEDLMICNASEPMCMAGIYGGFDSGVKNDTTSIFLESAYFQPTTIRKSSLAHGLRTEAAQHFEKGVDPTETVEILKIAAQLIKEIAGGEISSEIIDISSEKFEKRKVDFQADKVRKLSGAPITDEEILKILELLEIEVNTENEVWSLQVPLYRADVTRDVDVIEDILRIYGYNNIPLPHSIRAAIPVKKELELDQLYRTSSNFLVSNGFYEILTNSLTKSKKLENLVESEKLVKLLSSINVELDILRPNMLTTALDVISYNINRSQKNLKLFEYGKTYSHEKDTYSEELHLYLAVTGEQISGNWNTASQKVDFYDIKGIAESVLDRLGLSYSKLEENPNPLYAYQLEYFIGEKRILSIAKVNRSVNKIWDIKQDVFIADFYWDTLYRFVKKSKSLKINVSKFPSIRRDLALLLDKNTKFTEVERIAYKYGKKQLRKVDLFDVYEGDKIDENKKSYAVSYVFRDDDKTMTDKDIDSIMNKLIEEYHKQLNATLRS